MRPLIAVPAYRLAPGTVSGEGEMAAVPATYLRALHRAGGQEACLLPVPHGERGAAETMARFDGLLLIGGDDLNSALYGEQPGPFVHGVDDVRDRFELGLLRAALAHSLPVLAICRGLQLLNVALGGTLFQHVPEVAGLEPHATPEAQSPLLHTVQLDPDSRLAGIMGTQRPTCCSWHHQGLAKLGAGLRPVGWSDDGLIEAAELEGGWVIGVQWHPEESAETDPAQQSLFDALVREAAGVACARPIAAGSTASS